jgi:serine/threonine-protein kinase RsbT
MSNRLLLHYNIDSADLHAAGEVSSTVKKILKQLGVAPEIVRKVAISMYEAEINSIIHAGGGFVDVEITTQKIFVRFTDNGPGIEDISLAMQEGYSTASQQVREMGFGAGMGIPNMKRYSDDLKISSAVGEGTVVEITVFINN